MVNTRFFYGSNSSTKDFKKQVLDDVNKFITVKGIGRDDILEFKTNSRWDGGLRSFEVTISWWE